MQKKIIALAVAAAFSTPAFADVGFYGLVDGGIASVSGSGAKSDMIAVSGAASQSRLGVKATEDIGNGLTAVAVVEYGIDTQAAEVKTDTANNLVARQKMLAVAGDFGTVATGFLQTAAYDFLAKYDPLYGSGSSAHSIVAKGQIVGGLAARAQRAVAYISPNISGMTFAANYVTAGTGAGLLTQVSSSLGEKDTALLLSANYAVDALSVGAVYGSANTGKDATGATGVVTTNPAGVKITEFAFGASYDLGVAKVMGTYQTQNDDTTGAKADTVFSLAGLYPVSTGVIGVLYAANKVNDSAASSANALTAGYLHTFTKNTTGYVVYSSVKNGSAINSFSVSSNLLAGKLTNGGSSSLFGVGLRKKF